MPKYMKCRVCGMVWDKSTAHPRPAVQNPGPSCPHEGVKPDLNIIRPHPDADWQDVDVRPAEGPPAVDVVADLERRLEAVELAHEAMQTEIADIERRAARRGDAHAALRAAQGLLTDLAGPARRVTAYVDGVGKSAEFLEESGAAKERARIIAWLVGLDAPPTNLYHRIAARDFATRLGLREHHSPSTRAVLTEKE